MPSDYDALYPYDGDHDWFGKPNQNGLYMGRSFLRSLADMPGSDPAQGDTLYWDATTRRWVYAQYPPALAAAVTGGSFIATNTTWIATGLALPIETSKHYTVDIWLKASMIASTLEIRLDRPTGSTFVGTYQCHNAAVGSAAASEKVWDGGASADINSSTESISDAQWVHIEGILYGATAAADLVVEVRASTGTNAGIAANSMMTVMKQN